MQLLNSDLIVSVSFLDSSSIPGNFSKEINSYYSMSVTNDLDIFY